MYYGMSEEDIIWVSFAICFVVIAVGVIALVYIGVRCHNQRIAQELEDERFYRANAELAKTDPQTAAIDRQTYEIKKLTRQQKRNADAIASAVWYGNINNR